MQDPKTASAKINAANQKLAMANDPSANLYQDKIMQGGVGTKQGEDPSWWQGLANKFNSKFNTDKAMAHCL